MEQISGFSKLTKEQKIDWVCQQLMQYESNSQELATILKSFQYSPELQKTLDEFTENTLTNFPIPYCVAPNFLIDGQIYCVPMAIEESSVVAAASLGAKFWYSRGGFQTKILGTTKRGHIHFFYEGDKDKLQKAFLDVKESWQDSLKPIVANMEKRGGGIKKIELIDRTASAPHFYQWELEFDTCDAMGANFINSVLEHSTKFFKQTIGQSLDLNIVLSILSNYTPESTVEVSVECRLSELGSIDGLSSEEFATRMLLASIIAENDVSRAVTHNKGIMNGVDAVVIATGNDFRAVEACAHAFAARSGRYQSLSRVKLEEDRFRFSMQLPLALGTVGGITGLHPLSKFSMRLLKQPTATKLMSIVASVGLAQNFSAMRSLVTTGIQKGHMKMHLLNILHQLGANPKQTVAAKTYFADKVVSFHAVREFLQ
jgi:hydroxymethylglutaryl-CoA reductase